LPEPVISEIALGAIAHDVGQTMIAKHILDSHSRNKVEEDIFRNHCQQGVDIAKSSGEFSSLATSMIAQHHEHFDGTGYPTGKKGSEISLAARIFSIVNRYESLCGTATKDGHFITPAEVLRAMWQSERNHFDPAIFPAFIKLLGVYPPGSIVSLNDGSVGIVISPGDSSLHPKVLVYDPNVTKDEAEIFDLIADDGLQIESSINPKDLSSEIAQWMNVGTSFTLYFATPQ
jgi:HD-GYP domain-containing protein (c-di-GMP phosphodiesterase class II)